MQIQQLRNYSGLLVAGLLFLVLAPAGRAELLIRDGFVRGLPPGQQNTAAFMRLQNTGVDDLVIVSAWSSVAARTEIHHHRELNGMMRMEQVPSITVPAGASFVLKPGGHHLMLMGLQQPLEEGDEVTIRLQTDAGQQIEQQLPVRSVLKETKHHHHGHGG